MKPIFVIGFNKCGTTSLHNFFSAHGIPSVHWDNGLLAKRMLLNVLNGSRVFEGYDRNYVAFSDMLYRTKTFWFEGNSLFRQMFNDYPDAYFIYNKRPMENWIESRLRHQGNVIGESLLQNYKRIMNTQSDLEVVHFWRQSRIGYEAEIRDFFRSNRNFLEIDIENANVADMISHLIRHKFNPSLWATHNKTL